ncbi:MAG: polyhydroxyalkanoate synthesis repressor PhaR [Xanthomonadales bacterium]|nr:polyhydroxyalkanoate synthesis repressor PhaR [Xanthomonadales bacterium]
MSKRIIKKYANRRLYDAKASKHITLQGIRQLIVDGEDVEVIDDTSGEDITRSILLQIISEQELGGRPILGSSLLAQLIRFYGHPMQDYMGPFLQTSVDAFMQQQQQFAQQMQKTFANTPAAAMNALASQNMDMWNVFQKTFFGEGSTDKPDPDDAGKDKPD